MFAYSGFKDIKFQQTILFKMSKPKKWKSEIVVFIKEHFFKYMDTQTYFICMESKITFKDKIIEHTGIWTRTSCYIWMQTWSPL